MQIQRTTQYSTAVRRAAEAFRPPDEHRQYCILVRDSRRLLASRVGDGSLQQTNNGRGATAPPDHCKHLRFVKYYVHLGFATGLTRHSKHVLRSNINVSVVTLLMGVVVQPGT
jgi:hypothetical protein